MKHFEELIAYVNSHPNFMAELKTDPFNIAIRTAPYNPNWYIFNYDLISSDLSSPIVLESRGTVLEIIDGKVSRVIKAPFLKFFNVEERYAYKINFSTSQVLEKIDGQLITLSIVDGVPYWMTNGSFTISTEITRNQSEIGNYANLLYKALSQDEKEAYEYLAEKDYTKEPFNYSSDWVKRIPEGYTLMFELVSPYTPIKIFYDEIKLYFIGIRDNLGNEHDIDLFKEEYALPYDTPKRFPLHSKEEISQMLATFGEDKEGFVVVDLDFNRVKMKTETYFKLSYYGDLYSEDNIFYAVMCGIIDDYLAKVPDLEILAKPIITNYLEYQKLFDEVWYLQKKKYQELGSNRKDYAIFMNAIDVPPFVKTFFFTIFRKDNSNNKKFYLEKFKNLKYQNFLEFKNGLEKVKEVLS